MKRRWYRNEFGIEAVDLRTEFTPKQYRARIVDLCALGVPTIPVIGILSHSRLDRPSQWHVHKGCIEVIYCASGACEYESMGKRYWLRPGMAFVSREDEPHRQIECPKGYAISYLLFRPRSDAQSRWFAAKLGGLPRLFPCSRKVQSRFAHIISLSDGNRPSDELGIRLRTEVQSLLLEIIDSSSTIRQKEMPECIAEIARRIESHPEREYPLDELVAESGMSKPSFISRFKEAHGHSPHAYLLFCRVEAVKGLLQEGMSVKEISESLGFLSPLHCSRTFRNFVGCAPSRWMSTRARK